MKKQVRKQLKHWRRPLKKQGLTQRAKKMKEGDPDALRKDKSFLVMEAYLESDECWDVYNPDDGYNWR